MSLSKARMATATEEPEPPATMSGSTGSHPNSNPPTNQDAKTPPNTAKSIDIISSDMKEMLKKIQNLRHLGVENNGLPLPKIVVVGDQSTGKSSLIEGMSEIKVPRSAGCCTRCPLEINLSESKDLNWTCRVLLMRRYIFDGDGKLGKLAFAATKKRPLGPWIEQDPEHDLFITLTDRDKLQEAIKWAQLATLNPRTSYKEFIPGENAGTDENYIEVKFSPNVVRLDISAPKFPNLSFYDLPGVINVAEEEDERFLVTLVENLVREYIKADNCIVILTLPMTDDATNSSAARIVRDVKGAKERTLGVLTKPDRVQLGESYHEWAQILRGAKFSVGHGYYVVRNNPDPLVEHSQAREEESEFFSCGFWASDLGEHQERFGTRHLQTALSKLLLEQIKGSLPNIIAQLKQRDKNVQSELSQLPDPPSTNLPYLMGQKLTALNQLLTNQIDGGSSEFPLQKDWSRLASDFQKALIASRPRMMVVTEADKIVLGKAARIASGMPGNDAEDDELEVVQRPQPSPNKRKAKVNGTAPSSKRRRVATTVAFSTEHFASCRTPGKTFDLAEIREINRDTYIAGLPGLVNPKAIEKMNSMSVEHWKHPMQEFLTVTHEMLEVVLLQQLDTVFSHYKQTGLYSELRRVLKEFLHHASNEHCRHADENYNIEHAKPFTMATDALEMACGNILIELKDRRNGGRVNTFLDQKQALDPEAGELSDGSRKTAAAKLTEADIGPDEFAKEVEIMATIRGYYEIASTRFVDSVCQSTHTKLFSKCRHDLIPTIEKELGLLDDDAPEKLSLLMTEDPERQRRRNYLVKEKDKLDKAMESLHPTKREATRGEDSGPFVPTD